MATPTGGPAAVDPLPPELERRIAALESQAECGDDFDLASYGWLFALGIVVPLLLLAIGWWA